MATLQQTIDGLVGAVGVHRAWEAVQNAAADVLADEHKPGVYRELMARQLEKAAAAVRERGVTGASMVDVKYALELALRLPNMQKAIDDEHARREAGKAPPAPAEPQAQGTEAAPPPEDEEGKLAPDATAKADLATGDLAEGGGKAPEQAKKPPKVPKKKPGAEGYVASDEKAEWSTAFVNDLPDSSFFYISPGGEKDESGKTTPRDLRHLPYRDASGNIDLPHLRNALARLESTDIPASEKERIRAEAERLLAEEEGKTEKTAKAAADPWAGVVDLAPARSPRLERPRLVLRG